MTGLTLYNYFRSSAAYRVRIALHLKGLAFDVIPVHLLQDGGQQHAPSYAQLNAQELVPSLQDDGVVLTQSMANIEYLDESYPNSPLLPASPRARARVRALAQLVACDIHPLNNLRVQHYLEQFLQANAEQRQAWSVHWITLGLQALELQLAASPDTGVFCHGDSPTVADCCLIPQLFNARRIQMPLEAFATLQRIESACLALPAFQAAHPDATAGA